MSTWSALPGSVEGSRRVDVVEKRPDVGACTGDFVQGDRDGGQRDAEFESSPPMAISSVSIPFRS